MNFQRILDLLRRRWYLALVLLLILGGAFASVFAFYPSQYLSKAILVVTTPDNGGRIAADPRSGNDITNPLFNFQSGQNISAAILIASASSPVVQQSLSRGNPEVSYSVTNGSTNPEVPSSGPFIYVDAYAPTGALAEQTSSAVVSFIRTDLQNRQVAVRAPAPTFLSVTDVVSPTPAEQQEGNRLAAAAVAALLSTVVCLVLLDRLDRVWSSHTESERPRASDLDASTETLSGSAFNKVESRRPSPSPRSR